MAQALCRALTADLAEYCEANESNLDVDMLPDDYSSFFSTQIPDVDLSFYISRLIEYSECSHECFIVALIYLDRLQKRVQALAVTKSNCPRLLHTALLLAIKVNEDEVHSMEYYARVFGVTEEELVTLEGIMLSVLDWNLFVKPEEFQHYQRCIFSALGDDDEFVCSGHRP